MAKKKRTALPRVTVLAYKRVELARFAQAVETLGLLVDDLRLILKNRPVRRRKENPVSDHVHLYSDLEQLAPELNEVDQVTTR